MPSNEENQIILPRELTNNWRLREEIAVNLFAVDLSVLRRNTECELLGLISVFVLLSMEAKLTQMTRLCVSSVRILSRSLFLLG